MHLYEKTTESKIVYDGKIFKIKSDKVLLENNTEAVREVIMHHGGVCVLPLTENNEIIMVKQYRYPFSSVLLEIPAGKLNENEDHLECGKRELLEETGYAGGEWQEIMTISANASTMNNLTHCFLAEGVEKVAEQNLEATEDIEVHIMTTEEVRSLMEKGDMKQALMAAPLWKYFCLKG